MSALPEPELDPPVVPDDEPGEPALEELPDFAAEDPVVFDDAAEPVELLELSVDAVHVVEAVLDVESVSAASSVASVDLAEASVAFASMSALVSAAVSRVASV